MPATQEDFTQLNYDWDLGESGWKDGMDENFVRMGRYLLNLTALDRDLSAPPGSPAYLDRYIVGPTATGDWAGNEDKIAIWNNVEWLFETPMIGIRCYIVDEDVLSVYRAAGWSTGIAV